MRDLPLQAIMPAAALPYTTLSLVLLLLPACVQLPPRPVLPVETAVAVAHDSNLDSMIEPTEALHTGAAGFRLVNHGPEAFAARVHTGRLAGRTLDVQTYIWHADLVGRFLAQQILDAADRGVKVRLLLDDWDARAHNYAFAALAAHPNIEVRLFNPLASRTGTLRKFGEFMTGMRRLNHRMHNKTWIVDNRIAIVGGRNLGDEYFGAGGNVNFLDLDFVMVGPIVRDISASFDRYWNSEAVYPIATLSPEGVNSAALERLRVKLAPVAAQAKNSPYAEVLRRDDAVRRFVDGDWPLSWSSDYRFVSDDPLKATQRITPGGVRSDVLGVLEPALRGAQRNLTIVSPYFVPGKHATAELTKVARYGRQVRILTNSLATNDVAAVHGGYARYRKPLLRGGIELWELKPIPGSEATHSLFGSRGASLHTKGLEMDGVDLFVGSYNLDPRSKTLNCEQGVLVASVELATQFDTLFVQQTAPTHAWKVSLSEGKLSWTDGSKTFRRDPMASFAQRLQAWVTRMLPVESQL